MRGGRRIRASRFPCKSGSGESLKWSSDVCGSQGVSVIPAFGSTPQAYIHFQQTLRYCGAYSNSHRGKRAKSDASAVASLSHSAPATEPETEWIRLRRKSWAALIRLVYEADPLLCPKCGTQMKIVSVIKDGVVIDQILAHLQYKFQPLPLAAARPPPDTPTEWDFFSAD